MQMGCKLPVDDVRAKRSQGLCRLYFPKLVSRRLSPTVMGHLPHLFVFDGEQKGYSGNWLIGPKARCISLGRSTCPGRRTVRERSPPLQAQGATGRHHKGSQASFLLPEARRKEAREGSSRTQTESQEDSQGTG